MMKQRGSLARAAARTAILLGSLFVVTPAPAQWTGWQAHTSMRSAQALSVATSEIWVGTAGGLFSYAPATGEIQRYTTVDGLHGINVRAVAYDAAGERVWIGYPDGVIDELSVRTGRVRTYHDIARATQFTARSINALVFRGDTVFAATDFGVVVFDAVRREVRDAYSRFHALPGATPVNHLLLAPLPDGASGLWLATDQGVAYAALGHPNLREPSAWTVEANGLPAPRVLSLAYFKGRVYAGTARDAAVREPDETWRSLQFSGTEVRALFAGEDLLYGVDAFKVIALDAHGNTGYHTPPGFADLRAVVPKPEGGVWVGDGGEGLIAFDTLPASGLQQTSPDRQIIPAGPDYHLFPQLAFDRTGNLWAASAYGGQETGVYRLGPAGWTNFTARTTPELAGRASYDQIHTDALGNVWAGSVGFGLMQITPQEQVHIYDTRNSGLHSAPGLENYVHVGGIASEPDGTLWVTNQFAARALNRRAPDGSWAGWSVLQAPGGPQSVRYSRIFIDSHNQKWITLLAVGSNASRGLLVLDTQGAGDAPAAMPFRYLQGRGEAGSGLPGEQVTAIVEDRSGQVWIGTDSGIAYFFEPGLLFSGDPAFHSPHWPVRDGQYFFRFVHVNDLAVDSANRKWVASRTGAWLLNSEGNDVIEHFTAENSPLFSDNVLAVAIDERSGKVYFATDRGLLSWQGDAVAGAEHPGQLFIYPNPVRIRDDASPPPIYIDGLVDATDLRVLTVHGEVVASFVNLGGRARWDGLDRYGRPVPSGVYLVVAVGQHGEGRAHGKVVIIR